MSGTMQPQGARRRRAGAAEPACHVAIVDDDASVRRALARLLSACALSVRTYPSGPEFLQSLKQEVPDCLILDLQMPEMTGLEVVHYLTSAGLSLPVLIVTAQDELGIRGRCQLAGATGFLTKPFQIEPLLQALTAALGRPVAGTPVSPPDET